ncbi:MAG: hypothetical protein ACI91B_002985 [Planctomycetota bacterium]
MQLRHVPGTDDKTNTVEPGSPLLALRLGDLGHALDPERDYLLGNADDCDLRVAGAEPIHIRISVTAEGVTFEDLSETAGVLHNEEKVASGKLYPGDRLGIAGELIVVVVDDGTAAVVPIPELRQAASERRVKKVRLAAAALRRHDQTFAQQMATELRRAPWMMISLMLHLLLMLFMYWLTPEETIGGTSLATINIDVTAAAPKGDGPPAPPQVVSEPESDELPEDPELFAEEKPVPITEGPSPDKKQLTENPILASRKRPRNSGGGGDTIKDENGIGSGSFKKQVKELQESGLEIVFVFDSTGSMTPTILDTKSTIMQMLDVLRTLVPDARIGLVTYRDRGRREEYLVRQVPLDIDYWRATNFVQFIVAEGGGDRAEDVRAGLKSAFKQDWRRRARRVVVLAGDAPAHDDDFDKMLSEVRRFTMNRRSFVHTLITNPERAGDDTRSQFEKIAKAGRGTCEPIKNHDRILQRVLTLAFGTQYGSDVQRVIGQIDKERARIDVKSLHLARQGGRELRQALRDRPVPATLINALVNRPRRGVAITLLDLLADSRTPSHTRHAVAAALQRIFELPVPPIDTESNDPPSSHRIARLRVLAMQLPD